MRTSSRPEEDRSLYAPTQKDVTTYPSLLRNNSLRNDLELVQVEDVVDWRASCVGKLAPLLLFSDFLDNFGNGSRIYITEAISS